MSRLAKIIDNKIVYSDVTKSIILNDRRIFNPSEAEFREAGFTDLPTIEHDSKDSVYYVIQDGQIIAKVHKYVEPAKKYSKLNIIENVQKAGINWTDVQDWMKNAGLYNKWLVAQELSNDYPGFDKLIMAIKQQFPKVDIDQILRDSELK